VPTFAIDVPDGGGKIAISRLAASARGHHVLLRNYEGRVFRFPDPQR
jgi:lysine 2,3-aminomutase